MSDTGLTPELLEVVLEHVQNSLSVEQPTEPSLEQVWGLVKDSGLKQWAFEGAADLWAAQERPEGFATSVLGLLAAGILVGIHLQRAAAELSQVELPAEALAPGLTQH